MCAEKLSKKRIPVLEGYFTWPSDEPHLIGSQCKSCGDYFFPKTFICQNPNCKNKEIGNVEEVLLSRKGKLWSYTIQYYPLPPPFKSPEPFQPFGVGLMEVPEGLKIVGMLTSADLEDLEIDMEVELVVEMFYEDEQGNERVGWKFRPVQNK